jgi:hypothetical protein
VTLELPDIPRWVEAHGIAADPSHWRRELGDGAYLLGHDAMRVAVLVGGVDTLPDLPAHAILSERPLPRSRRAILHTLDGDVTEYEGAVRLPDDAPLPDHLAAELGWARDHDRPIWAVYVDGEPAAFAYAPWRSATWFDISVDVVPGARQLGLGTIVASALVQGEAPRRPVWGADEDNVASLRLAARLGFTAVDELWVAPPQL